MPGLPFIEYGTEPETITDRSRSVRPAFVSAVSAGPGETGLISRRGISRDHGQGCETSTDIPISVIVPVDDDNNESPSSEASGLAVGTRFSSLFLRRWSLTKQLIKGFR